MVDDLLIQAKELEGRDKYDRTISAAISWLDTGNPTPIEAMFLHKMLMNHYEKWFDWGHEQPKADRQRGCTRWFGVPPSRFQ